MLFHPAPEDMIVGSYSKVGMFEGAEILYQDVIGGPLITRFDRIYDIICTKYLVRPITYEKWRRLDNDMYPDKCLRECLINALIHNDYGSYIPIQIRIWGDGMMISDHGGIPDNWTIEKLLSTHDSVPINPKIANAFYISGFIENWGRGIQRIVDGYSEDKDKLPEFQVSNSSFQVILKALITPQDVMTKTKDDMKSTVEDDRMSALLKFMDSKEGRSSREVAEFLNLSSKQAISYRILRPMMKEGLIEFTIPDVPNSKNQRYRTTKSGRKKLK